MDTPFQYIREVPDMSPVMMNDNFEPHQHVTIDFYFEPIQDLRPVAGEKLEAGYREIGKQLMDAMWKKRLTLGENHGPDERTEGIDH